MKTERLKILIADDEYWIREKLRNMIDWGSYGLTLLEPAKDGEETMQRMERERPDILITDINMPFVSGVDLLRTIQEQYPDTVSFVVSGYDDFEYVKESFLAGSINYLVKPVTRIELVNAIIKALDLIAKRNDEKQELLKASSLIQDREFSQLLEHREMLAPSSVTGGRMDFTRAKLVLVKIHDMMNLAVHFHYDMDVLSFQLKQKIKKLLSQKDAMVFQYIYRSNEFILISEERSQSLLKMAENLLSELQKFTVSPITVVINQDACAIDTMYQAYVQAVSLLMARKYTQESVVICSGRQGGQTEPEQIQSRISEAQMQKLRMLWKSRNTDAIRKMIFGTIGIDRCSRQEWQYLEVKQTMRRIVNTWEEAFAGNGESHVDYEEMAESADKAVEKLDVSWLCEILEEMIGLAADAAVEDGMERAGNLVRQAAAYIDQYYYESLTLSGLAERYHLENSYFSRVFRKEMEENLSHYLARTRIEKAKEHIESGNANMTEIAFMVGYDDYTYFSKVFKKFTGVSPREYRHGSKADSAES